jgi:DNA repair protein RadC
MMKSAEDRPRCDLAISVDRPMSRRILVQGQMRSDSVVIAGVGRKALFSLIRETACRMAKAEVRTRSALSNWQALIAYLQTAMAHEQIEQFRIIFLDRKNNLIADEVQQRGTVNHTPVYPREVMKRALILNASALIVVHNNPARYPSCMIDHARSMWACDQA